MAIKRFYPASLFKGFQITPHKGFTLLLIKIDKSLWETLNIYCSKMEHKKRIFEDGNKCKKN